MLLAGDNRIVLEGAGAVLHADLDVTAVVIATDGVRAASSALPVCARRGWPTRVARSHDSEGRDGRIDLDQEIVAAMLSPVKLDGALTADH
ncbi:hypothetical protein AB1484_28650 [Parafrankia sp. FMc6]|uniref:hypothetical protein n=1 Tax=Parafrankia soli TaxID=2599596 RepID=UPI0034D5AA76